MPQAEPLLRPGRRPALGWLSPATAYTVTGVAATAAVGVVVVLAILVAYVASPTTAVALPAAAAGLAAIAWRPMIGVHMSVLAAPFEDRAFAAGPAGNLSLSQALVLVTVVSIAVRLVFERPARPPIDLVHVAFGVLVAAAALGVVVAEDALAVAKVVVMWTSLLFISVFVSRASRADVRRLLITIAVTAGILGAVVIPGAHRIQLVGGGTRATNRAEAVFTSPNVLAFFLLLALAPSLALLLRVRGGLRVVIAAASALTFVGLMLTLSRGAIIGAAVSLAVMLACPTFRRIAAGLLLVIAALAVFNVGPVTRSQEVSTVQSRLSSLGEERATNPRIQIYKTVPTIVADHPLLGIGEANFPTASGEYGLHDVGGAVFQHAHNLVLTIAAETGLVGTAALLGLLIALIRAIARSQRGPWGEERTLALGITAALVGLFVNSMTDYPLRANVVMTVLMLEIGALVAYARREPDPSPPAGGRTSVGS
jgi:O-antigen ligase